MKSWETIILKTCQEKDSNKKNKDQIWKEKKTHGG
jgi:hypothetical protein